MGEGGNLAFCIVMFYKSVCFIWCAASEIGSPPPLPKGHKYHAVQYAVIVEPWFYSF